MRVLLVGLVFLFNPSYIFAMDGNRLQIALNSNNGSEKLIAFAYIDASLSSIPYISNEINYKKPCISEQVTKGQIYDVVKNYLENYPEKRHMNGYLLTITSVSIAFPCE